MSSNLAYVSPPGKSLLARKRPRPAPGEPL